MLYIISTIFPWVYHYYPSFYLWTFRPFPAFCCNKPINGVSTEGHTKDSPSRTGISELEGVTKLLPNAVVLIYTSLSSKWFYCSTPSSYLLIYLYAYLFYKLIGENWHLYNESFNSWTQPFSRFIWVLFFFQCL